MSKKGISLVSIMVVLAALSLFTSARTVFAANQVVSDCGDSGLSTQLRAKINAANASGGGTITFTCGPFVTLQQGVLPTITTNITINGGGTVTISGSNASRIFVTDTTLTLNNITISNGYINGDDGGAIRAGGTLNLNNSKFLNNTADGGSGGAIIAFGALNITNTEFANNKAANGGALYVKWGNAVATITGSNFHDNQTTDTTNGWGGAILLFDGASATASSTTFNLNQALLGGAVYVFANSSLTLNNNSTLISNKANHGGGILNNGTATLTNTTLTGNETAGSGGGIRNNGTATLTNSTLSGNSTDFGGGILNNGTATLSNSTLSGNSAATGGGGIRNFGGTASLTNVTLSGNSAATGGGIYLLGGTLNVKNTLLAKGASGENCYNFTGGAFNLSNDDTCGFGAGRDNVTNLNLGPLANNGGSTKTHFPGAGSAAIDNAQCTDVNGAPVTSDQRNVSRPQGPACDVGSVEVKPATPTPTRTRTPTKTPTRTPTKTVTRTPTKTPTRTPTTQSCNVKPAKPTLKAPADNATLATTRPTLKWNAATCATKYKVVVKDAATGLTADKATVNAVVGVTVYKHKTDPLPTGQTYKWFVKACNGTFGCAKSITRFFTIQ